MSAAPGSSGSAGRDDHVDALAAEIDAVEREVVSRVDVGRWVLIVAVGAFVLLVAAMLPWVGSSNGWEVLLGQIAEPRRIGLLPRLFAASSLIVGVGLSAIAVFSRRWAMAWLCAFGSAFSVVHGIWSVWSRQTAGEGQGPGPGMVIALLTIAVLAVTWLRVSFSRPS